jgi:hypothetical protein
MTSKLKAIARKLVIISSAFLFGGCYLNAQAWWEPFETWSSSPVSVAGGINSVGNIDCPPSNSSYLNCPPGGGKWLLNNNYQCITNRAPNGYCYDTNGGVLNFHAGYLDQAGNTTGLVLVSAGSGYPSNGAMIMTTITPTCTGNCWINFGIYETEDNYRAIGFHYNGGIWLNIWGPHDIHPVSQFPGSPGTHTFMVVYRPSGTPHFWEYYMDDHLVWWEDVCNQNPNFGLGRGCFSPGDAALPRIELGFGSYDGTLATGTFGTVWLSDLNF